MQGRFSSTDHGLFSFVVFLFPFCTCILDWVVFCQIYTRTIREKNSRKKNKRNEKHNTLTDTLQSMAKHTRNQTFSIRFVIHTLSLFPIRICILFDFILFFFWFLFWLVSNCFLSCQEFFSFDLFLGFVFFFFDFFLYFIFFLDLGVVWEVIFVNVSNNTTPGHLIARVIAYASGKMQPGCPIALKMNIRTWFSSRWNSRKFMRYRFMKHTSKQFSSSYPPISFCHQACSKTCWHHQRS